MGEGERINWGLRGDSVCGVDVTSYRFAHAEISGSTGNGHREESRKKPGEYVCRDFQTPPVRISLGESGSGVPFMGPEHSLCREPVLHTHPTGWQLLLDMSVFPIDSRPSEDEVPRI